MFGERFDGLNRLEGSPIHPARGVNIPLQNKSTVTYLISDASTVSSNARTAAKKHNRDLRWAKVHQYPTFSSLHIRLEPSSQRGRRTITAAGPYSSPKNSPTERCARSKAPGLRNLSTQDNKQNSASNNIPKNHTHDKVSSFPYRLYLEPHQGIFPL